MEFQKIFFINNRNSKNEYLNQNDKMIEANNNKNNDLLTKVNSNTKIPNPILNKKILKKYTTFKNKHINQNNQNLLTRTLSFGTIENNKRSNKNNIQSNRYSLTKKVNDSNSFVNLKSINSLNRDIIIKENFSNNLDNTDIKNKNFIFIKKGNISMKRDIKININNNKNNKEIKNIVSLLTSKNKILKRNVIPNLKNLNAFNKNLNNSYYKTKKIRTQNYSNLASSKDSTSKFNMKKNNEKEILKLEKKNLNTHQIPGILNQKALSNLQNNIKVETNINYTDRNSKINIHKKEININKNRRIIIFKNCKSQKHNKLDSSINTVGDIESSRSNYYKNISETNSIKTKLISKIKPKIKLGENNLIKNTIFNNKKKYQNLQKNNTNINLKGSELLKKENNDYKINNNMNENFLETSHTNNMKKMIFKHKLNNIKSKKLIKKEKIFLLTNINSMHNTINNNQNKTINNFKYTNNPNTSIVKYKNINKMNKSNINFNKNFENNERFSSYKNLNESNNISYIKKLSNNINYLNINLNNWNNINNTTICNNSQNNTQNITIPNHINTIDDNNSIIFKKKLKNKFSLKHNDTFTNRSLINSNNNIIILNNISMNNLNNISLDYFSKNNKKKYNNSYKTFESIKKKLNNYVSKEKDKNMKERNKEFEKKREYYDNQKKIHKKKNNYKKGNRIKEQNLNGFNLKQIRNMKSKKNFFNKLKFISHNKINSSIIFNHYTKQKGQYDNINKYHNSNNLNIWIHTNKINNSLENILNKNYSTSNNQSIENIFENIRNKIKKGKEKSKINSEQVSPKKMNKMHIFLKKNNNANPNKTLRNSHKIKKKIIKDNFKEKSIINEFNDDFKNEKNNIKNCLSDLNGKTIEEINNSWQNHNSIYCINSKEKEKKFKKNCINGFSIDNKMKNKEEKINIIKKKKQKFLNILNNINERIDKNQKYLKKINTDIFLSTDINNVDSNKNNKNPQNVEEYITDIIESLLQEEDYYFNKKKYINPYYLEKEDSELTPEMRTIAVDWLVLIHLKIFKFHENTLFLAVQIFDRYLSKVNLNTEQTELLLYTSFMIASKHNEIDYVNMQEAIKLSQDKFNKDQIVKMESDILNKLDFEILSPNMCEFFIIFASYINLNKKKINQGLYILNILLVDFHMLKYPNFMLAFLVIKLIIKKVDKKLVTLIEKILKEKKLDKFLDIFNKESFEKICKKIKLLYNTFLETKYRNIPEKFADKEYNCVSKNTDI